MPRSSRTGEIIFDPEIEKIVRANRRAKRLADKLVEPTSSSSDNESEEEQELTPTTMARERTWRELAAPDLNQQPLYITYPEIEAAFELKSGLIHLLPTFHGLSREDPHRHLKEFHTVCSTMKPRWVIEDHIKMRAFPFSLADKAIDWLYYLPSRSIATWNDLKRQCIEKFFPASGLGTIIKKSVPFNNSRARHYMNIGSGLINSTRAAPITKSHTSSCSNISIRVCSLWIEPY
ncbi:hypothetical protein CRG98_010522 [Punica granatum]|uniref:Retrotransposon gag domain-containing protein n=1 Tax=Punica granatum TaxID=22663 RepID=A0A2I0KLG1_PUNGR|nr:hypothetical protein CRG98_010522 [Punica granatum]